MINYMPDNKQISNKKEPIKPCCKPTSANLLVLQPHSTQAETTDINDNDDADDHNGDNDDADDHDGDNDDADDQDGDNNDADETSKE